MIPMALPWGKIAGGVGLLILIGLAALWHGQAGDRKAELGRICDSVRLAADRPKLDCDQVQVQIGFLGDGIRDARKAINTQNDRVRQLGLDTQKAQQDAAAARQASLGRADEALGVSARLEASAAAGGPECEPSAALTEQWP
jgi:hypothetical protein